MPHFATATPGSGSPGSRSKLSCSHVLAGKPGSFSHALPSSVTAVTSSMPPNRNAKGLLTIVLSPDTAASGSPGTGDSAFQAPGAAALPAHIAAGSVQINQ